MARRRLLGTVAVLAAAAAWGADQPTSASCTAELPRGAVELGSGDRSDRTVLLRFEGLGVVAPDLAAFQQLARCASRSNGDLALRASAPVDAELFTQAVQRIAELVRLAVAEGQPNARMSVEIATRADRQPIIEVQVSMTVPHAPEPVAPPQAQVDPSKDPRIAWDRAQRYEERLAAQKRREQELRAAMTARELAAEEARDELEERAARAKFEAHQRARVLAEQARRSEQERKAAMALIARAEEKRKALEQRSTVREERVKKGQAERKAREERAKALDEAAARALAEERAKRAAVANRDESWVQPITRRDLVGIEPPRPEEESPSLPRGKAPGGDGDGRGSGSEQVSTTEPQAPAEPTKTGEARVPQEREPREASSPEPTQTAEPAKTAEAPAPPEKEPLETSTPEPTKTADAAAPPEKERLEGSTPEPTETAEPTKTAEAGPPEKPASPEPTQPPAPTQTAETEAPSETASSQEPQKVVSGEKPREAVEPVKTAEDAPPAEKVPAQAGSMKTPAQGDRKGEGDKEVKDALEPLKLAMLAYDEELKAKARRDQEAERAAAARQAALEERQAALAEKASKLNAAKLSAVGSEEKELARLERERLAEEKRLQAAALALAQKERQRAAEEARLEERARKLKERELTVRDQKAVDAARAARLELEAAAEKSRKEQEALAAERLKADEDAMAAREARLTALSKRVEIATVKTEALLPGDAGRRQITTALAQTSKDIQRCVDAHLKRFPIAGKTQAVLVLSIDLRGRVASSGIAQGPLKGSFIDSCLRDAAKSWRFPSSDSDFELEVPLTLVGH